MKKITLEIPDEVEKEINGKDKGKLVEILSEGVQRIKVQRALKLFRDGYVSLGRASEISGLREDELAVEARSNGIEPHYSEITVKEELG